MIGGFFLGIKSYLEAISVSSSTRVWKYFWLSGVVSIFVLVLFILASWNFGDNIGDWIWSLLPWERGIVFFEWLMRLGLLSLSILLFKYIVLVITSPFMSLVSERVEEYLDQASEKSSSLILNFFGDIVKSLRINVRNIFKELTILLGLYALSFIPGLSIVTIPLMFILQAYYAGFGLMDFYYERHFSIGERIRFTRENKGLAISLGSVFMLLLMIPILGWFVAPFFGAIAATIACLKKNKSYSSNL